MKNQPLESDGLLHQTVCGEYKFKIGKKSMQVGFTEQKISAHAGTATFWGWARPSGFVELLARCLPHALPQSNNHLKPIEKALSLIQGVLCGAQKLAQVAYLRRDPLMPELLGSRRVASQSTLSRFLTGFGSLAANRSCFDPLFAWTMAQLAKRPEGYTLDLDSTRLLHVDGHQQGVKPGYTRQGIKPCLHPLLAVLAEVRVVAQFWLRPGNVSCGEQVLEFFADLLRNVPSTVKLVGVRADSGFCLPKLLDLWESISLPYVVVTQLSAPIQRLMYGNKISWQPTEVVGTEVAQTRYQGMNWGGRSRRLILIRHRVADKKRPGGKMLFEVPGYVFQALVTSLPETRDPLWIWRYYNKRADCENVIKELQQGFGMSTLICHRFHATDAALSLAIVAYNLTVLFQRHLGWATKVTIHSLRYWLFITGGVLSNRAGQTTLNLAIGPKERPWWDRLWQKILAPLPNGYAVENRPCFC